MEIIKIAGVWHDYCHTLGVSDIGVWHDLIYIYPNMGSLLQTERWTSRCLVAGEQPSSLLGASGGYTMSEFAALNVGVGRRTVTCLKVLKYNKV